MWENQIIELGDILEKSTNEVTFKYIKPLSIVKLEAACGCTKPVHHPENQTIDVTYKADVVPKHLRYQGSFSVRKVIKVFSTTGRQDIELRATIMMEHFYKNRYGTLRNTQI